MQQAEQGQAQAVQETLASAPPDAVDWRDAHGFTALMHACTEGHADVVRLLLRAGATVNMPNPQSETALHLAASIGYQEVVRLLVEAGADASLATASGVTAADLAASLGHDGIAAFLGHGSVVGVSSAIGAAGAAAAGVELGEATAGSVVAGSAAAGSAAAGSAAAGSAVDGGAAPAPEPRELAFARLDANLTPLPAEALDELEVTLQMVLERIAQARESAS